jgi:arylsulfatase A-like enzyme
MSARQAGAALGSGAVVALVLAAALLVGGRPRTTQCVTAHQTGLVSASLEAAAACNDARLLNGPGASCAPVAPPSCSRSLVADAVALAYGAAELPPVAHDPDLLGAQLACQQEIGSAVATYASVRLGQRVAGGTPAEADAAAAPALAGIPAACGVSVAQDAGGVVLPAVGPQCADAVGAPGHAVEGTRLRDCLGQLLSTWVERIGPSPRPLRPNIVFILTDDQRADTTDATHALPGQKAMPSVRSRISNAGVEFTQGFATTPLCCPSRLSIFTGRYAHGHGVLVGETSEELAAFDDSSTLATWLDAAGYRTGLFGKYANGYSGLWQSGQPPYVPPGWDEWHAFKNPGYSSYSLIENGVQVNYGSSEAEYSTDVLRDKVIAFIQESAALGQPFMVHFSPISPHSPFQPALRHLGSLNTLAPYRPPSFNEPDVSDKPDHIQVRPPQSEPQMDYTRRAQMEMLKAVDDAVAAIAQTLEALGIQDDTVLIFTSDNGYFWGEHRLTAKHRPYEEAIRVPYIIRYRRLAPLERKDARLVLNLDFAPTFAELAGTSPATAVDGQSLVRVLDGTAPSWRSDFLTEGWPGSGLEWLTLREARWKYTEYDEESDRELYDLETDPYELENVASDPAHAARIAAMAARMRVLRPTWPGDLQ